LALATSWARREDNMANPLNLMDESGTFDGSMIDVAEIVDRPPFALSFAMRRRVGHMPRRLVVL